MKKNREREREIVNVRKKKKKKKKEKLIFLFTQSVEWTYMNTLKKISSYTSFQTKIRGITSKLLRYK